MAENLWALREQKRLSVATLATRAGLPIGLIMEYEAGTRSIDPRHLSRLAKALYVEESEIRLRCDPRPGARSAGAARGSPGRRLGPREPPACACRRRAASRAPAAGRSAARPRTARPPRPASEAKPPAPARASQLAHINDLLQRLGRDRASVEARAGQAARTSSTGCRPASCWSSCRPRSAMRPPPTATGHICRKQSTNTRWST